MSSFLYPSGRRGPSAPRQEGLLDLLADLVQLFRLPLPCLQTLVFLSFGNLSSQTTLTAAEFPGRIICFIKCKTCITETSPCLQLLTSQNSLSVAPTLKIWIEQCLSSKTNLGNWARACPLGELNVGKRALSFAISKTFQKVLDFRAMKKWWYLKEKIETDLLWKKSYLWDGCLSFAPP